MCVAAVVSRFIAALVLHRMLGEFRLDVVGRTDLPGIDYRRVLQVPKQPVRMRLARLSGSRGAIESD
jgi:hypothetical protein